MGSTDINGPHQGSLIDLPNGDWWFMHFQNRNNIGRVCHLQPMFWKEDWPVIGVDMALASRCMCGKNQMWANNIP